MRQRNEQIHGFAEYLVALVFRHELYGPDIVEAVGEFDKHYADIVVEGDEDAPEILGLEASAA